MRRRALDRLPCDAGMTATTSTRLPDAGRPLSNATNEPGFARDEDTAHLGEALKLPRQHEHLRPRLETSLQPLEPVAA